MSTKVVIRQRIEEKIVEAVVNTVLENGYWMQAEYDGEEFFAPTQDKDIIMSNLAEVETAYLNIYFIKENPGNARPSDAYVLFIFGNDMGETCISDYTTNLEDTNILDNANKITEAIEEGTFTIHV